MPKTATHVKHHPRTTKFGTEPNSQVYFVQISDLTLARLVTAAPSPEDELIAKEDPASPERDPKGPELTSEQLGSFISCLPAEEQDMVLLFHNGKHQSDIAHIFQMTQAAVSYRIMRAMERMRYHIDYGSLFTAADVKRDFSRQDVAPLDRDILTSFWVTTCQSETATELHITQGRVRHRLFRFVGGQLPHLADTDPEVYSKYLKGFGYLVHEKNWNIAREVVVHPRQKNRPSPSK